MKIIVFFPMPPLLAPALDLEYNAGWICVALALRIREDADSLPGSTACRRMRAGDMMAFGPGMEVNLNIERKGRHWA